VSGNPYAVFLSAVNRVEVNPPTENLIIRIGKNNDPNPGVVRWVNQPSAEK
jgi:hypothetical protein